MGKTGSNLRLIGIIVSVIFIVMELLNLLKNDFHPAVFVLFAILLSLCWYFEYRYKNLKK